MEPTWGLPWSSTEVERSVRLATTDQYLSQCLTDLDTARAALAQAKLDQKPHFFLEKDQLSSDMLRLRSQMYHVKNAIQDNQTALDHIQNTLVRYRTEEVQLEAAIAEQARCEALPRDIPALEAKIHGLEETVRCQRLNRLTLLCAGVHEKAPLPKDVSQDLTPMLMQSLITASQDLKAMDRLGPAPSSYTNLTPHCLKCKEQLVNVWRHASTCHLCTMETYACYCSWMDRCLECFCKELAESVSVPNHKGVFACRGCHGSLCLHMLATENLNELTTDAPDVTSFLESLGPADTAAAAAAPMSDVLVDDIGVAPVTDAPPRKRRRRTHQHRHPTVEDTMEPNTKRNCDTHV